MTIPSTRAGAWQKLPVTLRAVVLGLIIGMAAANVWLVLLRSLNVVLAAAVEAAFLGLYLWWASGYGPPRAGQAARATAFRRGALSPAQWFWATPAALLFAVTVHSAIVLLFRLVPFPQAAFRQGYDLSFIPTLPLRWLAVVTAGRRKGRLSYGPSRCLRQRSG